jgi:hypothetical protein
MAFATADVVARMEWAEGDMVILNDPYLGGTHLPDVTLIAPVFAPDGLVGFVTDTEIRRVTDNRSSLPKRMNKGLHMPAVTRGPALLVRHFVLPHWH